jgi:hypothetical protein
LKVGHHDEPQNTYGNPQYWVNSMPWLFPYGSGGAEQARPSDATKNPLTLTEWVRHCLQFHDDRFRKDPAFIFVVYKTLQIRNRVTLTRVMCKRIFGATTHQATNAATISDLAWAMDILRETKTLNGVSGESKQRLQNLMKSLKMVGAKSVDSIYARDACRGKILGLVTYYGLPSVFITINLSDISNPTISFWNNTTSTPFDLDTLLPNFPTKDQRAKMVSDDPVHAAEMFYVHITPSYLPSWDGKLKWETP